MFCGAIKLSPGGGLCYRTKFPALPSGRNNLDYYRSLAKAPQPTLWKESGEGLYFGKLIRASAERSCLEIQMQEKL